MGHKFTEIAFTESVREEQRQRGSRTGLAAFDGGEDYHHRLGAREADFIRARDSFYMASVGETGWPYLQHRGGPEGFVRVIDSKTLGFADFIGNRQYVSVGNLRKDDRVALFFMDYANRTRLKLLGRVRLIGDDEAELLAQLEVASYRAEVERGFLIRIEAFDWNCPQHITPRYTENQVEALVTPLIEELNGLRARDPATREPAITRIGDGPLPLVITGIHQLTPVVRAYELRVPDGGDLPAFDAGAHIPLPVRLADGSETLRRYSICSNPARRDIYEIAVLHQADGSGGSTAIHRDFRLGLRLDCGLPVNDFPLHADDRPAVLIAGGIGITPIKPMAQVLRARGNLFAIHYAGRSEREMAFSHRLGLEFGDDLRLYPAAAGERMDIEDILLTAPGDAVFYVCGPDRLIDAVTCGAARLGIDRDRIRFERFMPATPAGARPFRVELQRSGKVVEVGADQSMLDALLAAGIDAPYSCRAGNCRSCAVEVIEGEVDHRDAALGVAEREQDSLMCPCVSRARGERLTVNL